MNVNAVYIARKDYGLRFSLAKLVSALAGLYVALRQLQPICKRCTGQWIRKSGLASSRPQLLQPALRGTSLQLAAV